MNIQFEWDPRIAAANLEKHRVTFEEAFTVFDDPVAFIFDDEDHSKQEQDELRPEYRIDYRTARPNRFAGRAMENRVIVLDPDIAQVFTTSEAVNNILRAIIHTMPPIDKDADVKAE